MKKKVPFKRNRISKIRKKPAKFIVPADMEMNYRNLPLLQRFVSDRGKILSRRITGVSAMQQRKLCEAVKRAKYLGLVPVGGVKKF